MYLQVIIISMKNRCILMQYIQFKIKNLKGTKKPPIAVAGIVLKGQANLTSKNGPLRTFGIFFLSLGNGTSGHSKTACLEDGQLNDINIREKR